MSVRPHLPALTGLVLKPEKTVPTRLLQQYSRCTFSALLISAVTMTCCCFGTSTHISGNGLAPVVMLNYIPYEYWQSRLTLRSLHSVNAAQAGHARDRAGTDPKGRTRQSVGWLCILLCKPNLAREQQVCMCGAAAEHYSSHEVNCVHARMRGEWCACLLALHGIIFWTDLPYGPNCQPAMGRP